MTTTISPPIRIIALVGVLAAAGLGLLLFAHNRSASSNDSPSVAAPTTHTTKPLTTVTKTAGKPVKPKIVLEPGLPTQIAHSLRFSKVIVVALYAHDVAGDRATIAQARAAAKSAHAGFSAINVLDEKSARSLGKFVGTNMSPPAILIVKRPGKIVNQLSGSVDSTVVAQAALDAGAGR